METKENLHQGHRARMMEKFLNHPESLLDHELLEVLLFGLIPRVDTNKIAHKLLKVFGSLEVLFKASGKEIMCVEGVGKNTASHIKTIGEIYKRVYCNSALSKNNKLGTIEQAKKAVIDSFDNSLEEVLKVFLLDAKYKIITSITFENNRIDQVSISNQEIAKAIAINSPAFVLLAHNHPSNNLRPSDQDDFATQQIYEIAKVHGATLIDHFIVGRNCVYSYRSDNRLDVVIENKIRNTAINLEEI